MYHGMPVVLLFSALEFIPTSLETRADLVRILFILPWGTVSILGSTTVVDYDFNRSGWTFPISDS